MWIQAKLHQQFVFLFCFVLFLFSCLNVNHISSFLFFSLHLLMMAQFTATIAEKIVPAALEFLLQNQPKLDAPERISELVGNYGMQGVTVFSFFADQNTEKTGYYFGDLGGGQLIWFVYDKIATEALGQKNVYVFHFFPLPNGESDGCMANTMTGIDNSLVVFFYDEEKQAWGVSFIDYVSTFYHMPSGPSSSSQPSSVKSSSSSFSEESTSNASLSCAMSFLLVVAMIMVYLL